MTIIPDAIEPLVGWRFWYLHGPTCELRSLFRPISWRPGEAAIAKCMPALGAARLGAVPHERCLCGIHAAADQDALRRATFPAPGGLVVGEVQMWGKVVPHEYGWRAERAYPKSLFLVREGFVDVDRAVAAVEPFAVPVSTVAFKDVSLGHGPGVATMASAAAQLAAAAQQMFMAYDEAMRRLASAVMTSAPAATAALTRSLQAPPQKPPPWFRSFDDPKRRGRLHRGRRGS